MEEAPVATDNTLRSELRGEERKRGKVRGRVQEVAVGKKMTQVQGSALGRR